MQKRMLLANAVVGVLLFCSSLVYAETITTDSKVTDVTVYAGSARVTRAASLQISAGEHSIVFEGIVPNIEESSLTVSGSGVAGVKIFGAQLKKEYLEASPDERVKELEKKIEALADQINTENAGLGILDQEREFVNSLKLFSKNQLPKDLVTKTPSTNDLEGTLNFISTKLENIEKKKQDTNLKIRDLMRQKEAQENELSQLKNGDGKIKQSIAVDVEAAKGGKLDLSVSYLAYGASWYPVYDARASFEKNQVELISFGNIRQTTGEDWNDVNLVISTARPSVGGRMPELGPWYLYPYQPYGAKARLAGVAGGMRDEKKAIEVEAEYWGNAPASAPVDSFNKEVPAQAQIAYAQAESKGTAVVYKIAKAATIKSDAVDHRVPISAQTLAASFEYAATPKLSPYAYLHSEVTNSKDGQLLPGRVNIFLDNDYVGASDIAKAIGAEEKFDLYLGIDEGVTVQRKLVEEKADDTMLGGIPSPNRTISYTYKLTVENYKAKGIQMSLFDQIPVSQDDKIKVKNIKFSAEPNDKDYKDKKGVLRWHFELAPKGKKDISYSYMVEFPRSINISGL